MAKATNIFDFSKHSKDLFLVAGSHTTQKHIDWMKAGQRTITRYNLPMNETTVACLSNNPKYLLLYLHYKTAEQTLQLFSVDHIEYWNKAQMRETKYPTPHQEEYVVLFLSKEHQISKMRIQPLREYARKKDGKLPRNTSFVLNGNDICQALIPKRIRFIDLFAGLGGIRLGLEQALQEQGLNGECVFTSEIKPYALRAYNHNFAEKEVVAQNITKLHNRDIPVFNILLGGFPCQAFSSAGAGKGFADTRGTLFFEVQRILKENLTHVDGFILENVEGLVMHDMRPDEPYEDNGIPIGRTLATILHILRDKLKFNVTWAVLNAADYGVPQKRKRIYIVGCKKKFGTVTMDFDKQPEVGTGQFMEQGLPCLDNAFSQMLLARYTPEELAGKALKDKRGGKQNIHSWDIGKKGKVSPDQHELLNRLVKERRKHSWAPIIGIEWMDGMPLTEAQIATFFPHPDLHNMLADLVKKQYLVYEHPKQRVWHSDENGNKWSTRVPDEKLPKGYNIVTGKLSFEISSILDPQRAANTIVAMDMNTLGVIDGMGIRHLTLREGLRLFGYPENYDLDFFYNEEKGIELGYDLLGNSVCVPVIKLIANRLIQQIYAR